MSNIAVARQIVRPVNVEISHLEALSRNVSEHTDYLGSKGTPDGREKLLAINRSLGSDASALPDLSDSRLALSAREYSRSIVEAARREGKPELFEAASRLHHALRIARGDILVPELSKVQQQELIEATTTRFQVNLSGLDNPKQSSLMSFIIPARQSYYSIAAELATGCRALQRDFRAIELDNFAWIERHGKTILSENSSMRITVGHRIPEASNKAYREQEKIAHEQGVRIPDREVGIIAHSLAYLLTGRSIFSDRFGSFSVKIATGTALTFSDQGLRLEYGNRVNLFSQVYGVKTEMVG